MNFDHKKFFDGYKEKFDPTLNDQQVAALEFLLTSFENEPLWDDYRHIAYAFATAHIETFIPRTGQRYEPVEEFGANSYFNKYNGRKDLGNTEKGDGLRFKGRGFVQITGRKNYTKFSKLLGIDLVKNPKLALEPETSFRIMTLGMHRGLFTGKKLTDSINDTEKNYREARRIINGQDRAGEIALIAKEFEEILRESKVSAAATSSPANLSSGNPTPQEKEQAGEVGETNQDSLSNASNTQSPETNQTEPQTLTKERPSTFVKIGTMVTGAIGTVTAFGVNLSAVIQNKLEQITPAQIFYLVVGLAFVALAIYFYDRSAKRANLLNQKKMEAAQNKNLNTVEFVLNPKEAKPHFAGLLDYRNWRKGANELQPEMPDKSGFWKSLESMTTEEREKVRMFLIGSDEEVKA